MQMNIKNILLTVVIAGVVSVISASVIRSEKVVQEVKEKTSLGALSSPDIASPYLSFGNVRRYAAGATLNQASSTLCSLLSPASTSTLVSAGIQITTGTSTAVALEIGKGAITSTTTRFAYRVLASGVQATLTAVTASTTATGGSAGSTFTTEPDAVFAPNTYLNFKYGGAPGATNTFVGGCTATWETLIY